jgi:precorrin-2 dehydrogenase/sirohydrochlorin ferrochelatase
MESFLLPITLSEATRVGLFGAGDALGRRAALLIESGIKAELLSSDADDSALMGLKLLFLAGLDVGQAHSLASRARALGVLVNVEDEPELCDFHVPAIVRRGDLVLTVSTGGRAPGLARRMREWLEQKFGQEWQGRLNTLGEARLNWRADGVPPAEVSRRTSAIIAEQGWLP